MNTEGILMVLEMIAKDMENDAKEFDGKPFDHRTVAKYFGHHGAAISALAKVITEIVNNEVGKE